MKQYALFWNLFKFQNICAFSSKRSGNIVSFVSIYFVLDMFAGIWFYWELRKIVRYKISNNIQYSNSNIFIQINIWEVTKKLLANFPPYYLRPFGCSHVLSLPAHVLSGKNPVQIKMSYPILESWDKTKTDLNWKGGFKVAFELPQNLATFIDPTCTLEHFGSHLRSFNMCRTVRFWSWCWIPLDKVAANLQHVDILPAVFQ